MVRNLQACKAPYIHIYYTSHVTCVCVCHGRGDSTSGNYETKAWLERIIIIGYDKKQPTSVSLTNNGKTSNLRFKYDAGSKSLIIGRPGVNIAIDFTISIN
jgi:hypothetical protein